MACSRAVFFISWLACAALFMRVLVRAAAKMLSTPPCSHPGHVALPLCSPSPAYLRHECILHASPLHELPPYLLMPCWNAAPARCLSYDTTVVFQRLVTAAPAPADQCVLHTTSPACATLHMGWLAWGALPQQRVQKPAGNLGGLHCQLSARGVHLPRCLAGLFAHSGCVL